MADINVPDDSMVTAQDEAPEIVGLDDEPMDDDNGQVQHEQVAEADAQTQEMVVYDSIEPMEATMPDAPEQQDEQEDPSSLFIPEHSPSSPRTPNQQEPSTDMAVPIQPPPQPTPPRTAIFARIREMQKRKREQKAMANRQAPTYTTNADPNSEEYLEAVRTRPLPSMALPVTDEEDEADKKAIKEYEVQKRHYDELKERGGGKLSFRQDVAWMKIKGAEEARKRKRARDIAKEQEDGGDEPGLFPVFHNHQNHVQEDQSDDPFESDPSDLHNSRRTMPNKSGNMTSMRDAELDSMRVALEAQDDLPRKKRKSATADDGPQTSAPSGRGKGKAKSTAKVPKAKAALKKAPKSGGRGSKKHKEEVKNAYKQASSLFNSNVFYQQAGANATEQPTFRSRVKADALKELIASVPHDAQKKARGEMAALLSATKDFDGRGSMRADHGLWRLNGMSTSLKPYQVMGSAFMRRRENGAEEPRGGLMADQMGLGKTLMMLANIVNGQPPRNANGPKTTLLVASPALLTQWKSEIEQHTNIRLRIMRYGAGTRVDSSDAIEMIGAHDIVLTSYTEIMKSYPKNEPPIECQTAEQKIDWWKQVYDEQRGVFHRMMFLRIVLDEAQAINNHTSRTSIACRALMARHKWALSGTPILNSLTELYAYFKFLGVPHTGSFKIFKHNYCDTGDTENTERLLVRLSQFMIRRTHADEMFGAPILKLPPAEQTTYWCEFNSVERCIYDIVHSRFTKRINVWAKKGTLETSYSNVLVMLLRLRQLSGHILMLQFVIRDLLEREDIERIKEVVDKQAADSNTRRGKSIIAIRKQLDKLAAEEKKKRIALEAKKAAKRAAKNAAKAAAKARGEVFNEAEYDAALQNEQGQEQEQEQVQEDVFEHEQENENAAAEGEEQDHEAARRFGAGKNFGKDFNFKPFLSSLKTGESWKKAKQNANCSVCDKIPREALLTSCGHLICNEPCYTESCLDAAEQGGEYAPCMTCGITPTYAHPCDPDGFDTPDAPAQGTRSKNKKKKESERSRVAREDIPEDWLDAIGNDVLPSAKTIAVKSQIMNWLKENPRVKIIVYTQFLAMVRILARVCAAEGWKTEQYHGKMSLGARDKAISTFAEDPNSKIMLASLRCGGLGLNLTMASKVIMIDPWWNSASEQQAFCRVFRIGQEEATFMSRLCVKNTIDERLINMQQRKDKEIAKVMDDDGTRVQKMDMRKLMKLFGNLEEDSEGRPFIMVDNPDPRGGFRADRDDEGFADEL